MAELNERVERKATGHFGDLSCDEAEVGSQRERRRITTVLTWAVGCRLDAYTHVDLLLNGGKKGDRFAFLAEEALEITRIHTPRGSFSLPGDLGVRFAWTFTSEGMGWMSFEKKSVFTIKTLSRIVFLPLNTLPFRFFSLLLRPLSSLLMKAEETSSPVDFSIEKHLAVATAITSRQEPLNINHIPAILNLPLI